MPASLVPLLALLLASCASSTDPQLDIAAPSLAAGTSVALTAAADESGKAPDADTAAVSQTGYSEPLPATVASIPLTGSTAPTAVSPQAAAAETRPATTPVSLSSSADDADAAEGKEPASARTPAQLASAMRPDLIDPGKRKFLSAFFGDAKTTSHPLGNESRRPLIQKGAISSPPLKSRTLIKLASADPGAMQAARASPSIGDEDALPGVRKTMLFEIRHKNSVDDDSNVDINEDDDLNPVRTASAGGMARLAPNGLLKQNDTVDTACLKPDLVRVLRSAEEHFGQKAVITSGYRDPERNRRVRGATHSLHMACMAADVQMPGVSKWELATFFRAIPGRGGVGTYCHTSSVHVDTGPERDWNWRCGRTG